MGYCQEEDERHQTQQCRWPEGRYQSNLGIHYTWAVPQVDCIHCRIDAVIHAKGGPTKYWVHRNIDLFHDIQIFSPVCQINKVSVSVTYACKTWKMTQTFTRKLDVFHHRCLQRIPKITYYVKNMEVFVTSTYSPSPRPSLNAILISLDISYAFLTFGYSRWRYPGSLQQANKNKNSKKSPGE